jgi:hypothetical protein
MGRGLGQKMAQDIFFLFETQHTTPNQPYFLTTNTMSPTSEPTKTHQINPPRSYLSHVEPFYNIISYSVAIGLCFLDPKCCSAHENEREVSTK